ncbi:hypothetical protein [Flavobacterium sp.]
MSWKIQQHKRGNSKQEIRVSILVKELDNFQASTSSSWIDNFHDKLKGIRSGNIYVAENFYRATPRNEISLEVWKLKANGDFNYKMFTVTRVK